MISLGVLARVSFETVKISVPTIVDGLRGRVDPRACDQRLAGWSAGLLRAARVTVVTQGRENIVEGESYVVMSNHQSHFDIPVLFKALGIPVRMVAKKELFSIPVMGVAMRYAGFVEVDRSKKAKALKSLSRARARLEADRTSVWIAPEGTRSVDGRLTEFKRGGFHMAVAAGLRILPVAIGGTVSVHRSGELVVNKDRTVRVTVCPPIDPATYGRGSVQALIEDVRASIESALEEA